MKGRRKERIEKLLLEQISSDIQGIYELYDKIVSVTRVVLSNDLSSAKIYITAVGDVDEVLEILRKSGGYLRRQLAMNLNLRYTPRLSFFKDEEEERARRVDEILAKLREEKKDSENP